MQSFTKFAGTVAIALIINQATWASDDSDVDTCEDSLEYRKNTYWSKLNNQHKEYYKAMWSNGKLLKFFDKDKSDALLQPTLQLLLYYFIKAARAHMDAQNGISNDLVTLNNYDGAIKNVANMIKGLNMIEKRKGDYNKDDIARVVIELAQLPKERRNDYVNMFNMGGFFDLPEDFVPLSEKHALSDVLTPAIFDFYQRTFDFVEYQKEKDQEQYDIRSALGEFFKENAKHFVLSHDQEKWLNRFKRNEFVRQITGISASSDPTPDLGTPCFWQYTEKARGIRNIMAHAAVGLRWSQRRNKSHPLGQTHQSLMQELNRRPEILEAMERVNRRRWIERVIRVKVALQHRAGELGKYGDPTTAAIKDHVIKMSEMRADNDNWLEQARIIFQQGCIEGTYVEDSSRASFFQSAWKDIDDYIYMEECKAKKNKHEVHEEDKGGKKRVRFMEEVDHNGNPRETVKKDVGSTRELKEEKPKTDDISGSKSPTTQELSDAKQSQQNIIKTVLGQSSTESQDMRAARRINTGKGGVRRNRRGMNSRVQNKSNQSKQRSTPRGRHRLEGKGSRRSMVRRRMEKLPKKARRRVLRQRRHVA